MFLPRRVLRTQAITASLTRQFGLGDLGAAQQPSGSFGVEPLCGGSTAFFYPVLSSKQPLEALAELPTNSQQNLSPDLNSTALHNRKIVLTDANAVCELLLSNFESAQFP